MFKQNNPDSQKRLLGLFKYAAKELPEQKIPAYEIEDDDDEEEEKSEPEIGDEEKAEISDDAKDDRDIGEGTSSGATQVKKMRYEFQREKENRFLRICRKVHLDFKMANFRSFFEDSVSTMKIGTTTKLLLRPGFDLNRQVWKMYICQERGSYKPVTIEILCDELQEVIKFLQKTIQSIEKSKESLLFRVRPFYFSGIYFAVFQNPKTIEDSTWLGPFIRLPQSEMNGFLDALIELKRKME